MSGARSLRFMGKVFGTKKDYWIACGTLDHIEEPNQDKQVETRGSGVNTHVFWVTDNILSDWIQLPECKPEYIAFARLMKHVMTGELNALIDSNPPFPGKERHFLRAQLARIFAATHIAPKGLYEMDEETNKMKMAEEFALPGTDELKSTEVWGNVQASILKVGRTSHMAPEGLDDEARDGYIATMAESDAQQERFRAI
jgi:radial spoke head protein 4A